MQHDVRAEAAILDANPMIPMISLSIRHAPVGRTPRSGIGCGRRVLLPLAAVCGLDLWPGSLPSYARALRPDVAGRRGSPAKGGGIGDITHFALGRQFE